MRSTTLYRYFDAWGDLLYVGITVQNTRRLEQHARASRWWSQAVRCDLEHFPDRASAIAAETRAILDERPRFNVQGAVAPIAPWVGPGTSWLPAMRRLRRRGASIQQIAHALGVNGERIEDAIQREQYMSRHALRRNWTALIVLMDTGASGLMDQVLDSLPGQPVP